MMTPLEQRNEAFNALYAWMAEHYPDVGYFALLWPIKDPSDAIQTGNQTLTDMVSLLRYLADRMEAMDVNTDRPDAN